MNAQIHQTGFTLIGLLFLIAGLGVAMALLGTLWHTVAQREKEAQLLFVGEQYRHAIEDFSQATPPDGQKRLPKSLEELLLDPRFSNTVRHLRRLYPDPMTAKPDWGLVQDVNGISGVFSLSDKKPFKSANFPEAEKDFLGKASYKEWVFAARAATDPGQAAPAVNSTDAPPTEATKPVPPTVSDQLSAKFACMKLQTQGMSACGDMYKQGDMRAWNDCRNGVQAQYRACLAGN